ncbi:MAG: quinone-interacting membrane-bound oxidoreductase complex subunit QmoC [Nitrospirae bacterium]|nr:quinone-interacting membrane-bound oxidoreductase complex subunit QmoC [Nitrospirota bacterium]
MEQVIRPDLSFVNDVIASGGESLKKCYQCATCTVVCNVTPDSNPFPRKEMIWAQWGLRDKFIGNPDVWLCHQCNDCTAYCPRGAKPGEVIGAIRKQSIMQYSQPCFMARLVNDKKFMPLIFLLPAVLFAVVLTAIGKFTIPQGEIVFLKFVPVLLIQALFVPALGFGSLIGILGVRKYWKDMSNTRLSEKQAGGCLSCSTENIMNSVIATVQEVLAHQKFKKCDVAKDRFSAHFFVFYSFIALGIATAIGALYIDILDMPSPFKLGYGTPVKLFGTIGAIGLLIGVLLMISNRFKNAQKVGIGSYFDWLLITVIGVVMASGILSWVTRLANIPMLAYPIYFVHLISVFSLFVYLPYSKLSHIFYRVAAIVYAKYTGRDKTN